MPESECSESASLRLLTFSYSECCAILKSKLTRYVQDQGTQSLVANRMIIHSKTRDDAQQKERWWRRTQRDDVSRLEREEEDSRQMLPSTAIPHLSGRVVCNKASRNTDSNPYID